MNSATPSTTSIEISATFSSDGEIYCNAYTEEVVPSSDELKNSTFHAPSTHEVATPISITGLAESTTYFVYCYAEDSESVPMTTPIADTLQTVTTLGTPIVLTVGDKTVDHQTLTVSLMLSVTGHGWCGVYEASASEPTATQIKEQNHDLSLEANVAANLVIASIAVGDHLLYCYAESQEGQAMTTDIKDTKYPFTICMYFSLY